MKESLPVKKISNVERALTDPTLDIVPCQGCGTSLIVPAGLHHEWWCPICAFIDEDQEHG